MSKMLHVFFDTDMRLKHPGLSKVAARAGKKVATLEPGDILCFINKAQDRVMVLAGTGEKDSYGVLGYYRSPHGRIDLDAIQYIPGAFAGSEFRMTSAIRESLEKKLVREAVRA